jgi:hypothetical protein
MTTGQNQPKKKTLRKQIILVSIVLFLDEGGRVQKFSFLLFFHMIFIHISQNKASIKEMIATKKVNVITTLTFISFVVMLNNFVLVLFGVSFTNMTVHYWLVGIFLILAVIHSIERLLKR